MLLARNRNYRLLFSASAVSNLGDGISTLAFPWLATLITRDAGLIALVAFAGKIPWLFFTIPAGVLTDRGDRQALMVRADVLRVLLTTAVMALAWQVADPAALSGRETLMISLVALAAFCLGAAEVVRDNAAQTALPAIVPPGDLERANGHIWSIEQVMGAFVGPPVAGVLIALAVPAPFAVNAVSFALAGWLVWMIALPPRIAPARRSWRSEAAEGWQWLRAHPLILRLALMLGGINAIAMMGQAMMALYAQEVLGLSAGGLGLLLTAGAAGGVVGGLFAPGIAARIGGQAAVILALVLLPVSFALIAFIPVWPAIAAALFLEMFAALLWNVVTVSYRQRMIPDALLGRVNSLYRMFGWGMMPFGALIAGALVEGLAPGLGREAALRGVYGLGALASVAMLGYAAARLRIDA